MTNEITRPPVVVHIDFYSLVSMLLGETPPKRSLR